MAQHRGRTAPANDNREAEGQEVEPDSPGGPLELATLDFPAQLVVWAVRAWVQAYKTEQDFDAITGQTFTRFDLQAAALSLDGVMRVLAASASRPIDIRCTQCRYLSPDEAILLDTFAAGHREGYFMATVALRKLMPGTAARVALPHAVAFARGLAAAGMTLRAPTAHTREDLPARSARRTLH
jgi:hypothetical protein